MVSKLTHDVYQKLIDENIAWLESMPRTLERDHIIGIVKDSVRFYYSNCKKCGAENDSGPSGA